MDEVKLTGIRPRFLRIVNFKSDIWWEAMDVSKGYIRGLEFLQAGWYRAEIYS
jgi:hypothetical protein